MAHKHSYSELFGGPKKMQKLYFFFLFQNQVQSLVNVLAGFSFSKIQIQKIIWLNYDHKDSNNTSTLNEKDTTLHSRNK